MKCVRNWLHIKKHRERKGISLRTRGEGLKFVWYFYHKRNKFLETIGIPDASRQRVRKSVSNIAQPPNRIYEGSRNYVWDIFGMTGRPRRVMLQSNIRDSFLRTKYRTKLCAFYEKKRKKNGFSLFSSGPKSADTIQINQARHLRHTRVCSISILRVAVVSRTSRDIRYTQLGARDKELSHTHTHA